MIHPVVTLLLLVPAVLSALVPTGPGPNDVFRAGEFCSISWTPDSTSTWTNVTIDLMSGSNANMTWVATVIQGLDGSDTSLAPYNWTCPDVDPYGPIYFYQFTQLGQDAQWTTRFTIASPSGDTAPAAYAAQPNGDQVAWGAGHAYGGSSSAPGSTAKGSGPPPSNQQASNAQEASGNQAGTWTHAGATQDLHDGTTTQANSSQTATSSRRPRPSRLPSASAPTLPLPSNFQDLLDDYNQFVNSGAETHKSRALALVLIIASASAFLIAT